MSLLFCKELPQAFSSARSNSSSSGREGTPLPADTTQKKNCSTHEDGIAKISFSLRFVLLRSQWSSGLFHGDISVRFNSSNLGHRDRDFGDLSSQAK